MYFISAGKKKIKDKKTEPKSNLDVILKIEVTCAYHF